MTVTGEGMSFSLNFVPLWNASSSWNAILFKASGACVKASAVELASQPNGRKCNTYHVCLGNEILKPFPKAFFCPTRRHELVQSCLTVKRTVINQLRHLSSRENKWLTTLLQVCLSPVLPSLLQEWLLDEPLYSDPCTAARRSSSVSQSSPVIHVASLLSHFRGCLV